MARGAGKWTQETVDGQRARNGARTEYRDPDQRNLYHVIQPSGHRAWAVRYRRVSDGISAIAAPCRLRDARHGAQVGAGCSERYRGWW